MLRITQKTSGTDTAKYFFGYYSEQEIDKPVWLGKGAEKLNLEGKAITAKDFESVSNNIVSIRPTTPPYAQAIVSLIL